eukprot:NODE_49_length_31687_cov_0.791123.p10 type:complete len:334 gc:universal NODE_49_length_31687_cov_0.791123:21754-20753(-)
MTINPSNTNPLNSTFTFTKLASLKHNVKTTIQHWQLRDLIACPYDSSEIFHVYQNNVSTFNSKTNMILPIMKELTFSPTSMHVGHGYVAAGGQRSQLMVRQLATNWYAHTSVGGSINNSIAITNHPLHGHRLLICNNDESIKAYTLPGLQRISSLQLPTAVNYVSVSPDGTKMIATGDVNSVFLYHITNNGDYILENTLSTSADAGFACSWNQSSERFAVASQDGAVSVFDIRNTGDKIAKLQTHQWPRAKGAARNVKFSPSGSIDLLMFSEHVSYVHLVDARTFNEKQVIRVAPDDHDLHISGICFSPDSKRCFVGISFLFRLRKFHTGLQH